MLALTVKAAKSRFDEVVTRVRGGELVVLLDGSRKVASISPFFGDEPPLRITDAQAKRLMDGIRRQRVEGRTKTFSSVEQGVEYLRRKFRVAANRKRRRAK